MCGVGASVVSAVLVRRAVVGHESGKRYHGGFPSTRFVVVVVVEPPPPPVRRVVFEPAEHETGPGPTGRERRSEAGAEGRASH